MSTPQRVYATFTPTLPVGPYRARSVRPATIVGSANGRSMSVFTRRLPGNSSRTSVQASAVPVTALIATTPPESSNVSSSAARASGFHATCQKWCQPPLAAFAATAASGTRTMMLR